MDWKKLLAYITGSVDQELLVRNEYLVAENRILRAQINGRPRLTDGERKTLAEIEKRLGRKVLEDVASIVRPETILAWHRKLVARKSDGSKKRKYPGRPRISAEIEELVVRIAKENRSWGCDRIAGALQNLGRAVSDQTVGNILKRHGIPPAPERRKTSTWKELIRSHLDVVAATDFFTAEVWTKGGLVTYYILFFMQVATRRVHIAGITPYPAERWMIQMARNVTVADVGFLSPGQYLIHDRDSKYGAAFVRMLEAVDVNVGEAAGSRFQPESARGTLVRSVRDECLSKLILFGEASLGRALAQFDSHFHAERNHQGTRNVLLFPSVDDNGLEDRPIECRERLGGLLKFYYGRAG